MYQHLYSFSIIAVTILVFTGFLYSIPKNGNESISDYDLERNQSNQNKGEV